MTAAELERLRRSVGALQSQNATFRQLVTIHDRLGGLVLQGADVAAITQVLAELVGRRVLLLDTQLQATAAAAPPGGQDQGHSQEQHRHQDGQHQDGQGQGGQDRPGQAQNHDGQDQNHLGQTWAPAQPYVSRVLESLAAGRRPLRVPPMPDWDVRAACVLAPIAVGEAILGYLAILQDADAETSAGEDVDLQIVQHAAAVYALSLMRERMAAEVAQQLKNELFEGLLLGRAHDEQVAYERAVRLGYDPSVAYRALVAAADKSSRLLDRLAEFCADKAPRAIVTVRPDELVVLAPDPDAQPLARRLRQQAALVMPGWPVTVGIGGVCASPQAIARSYEQARRAVSTAVRFGKGGEVVAFEDLGLYRLLFHVSDPTELRGFVDQVLGPLIDYDRQRGTSLVSTLATFLEHNGNLQASARQLDLHVNSVAYRVQRIQAIAGLDLDRADDRLLAQVALKILDGLR